MKCLALLTPRRICHADFVTQKVMFTALILWGLCKGVVYGLFDSPPKMLCASLLAVETVCRTFIEHTGSNFCGVFPLG